LHVGRFERGKVIMARLDYGTDIVEGICEVARSAGIKTGVFSAIGALQRAEVGYYDQETHEYHGNVIDQPMELVSCSGNISIRDGTPLIHVHAALADRDGTLVGGHLQSGTIFAAEVCVQDLEGDFLVREHDPTTDLFLWGGPD